MSGEHDTPPPGPLPAPDVVAVLVAHHRQFLAFLQKRVGDRALAEDILQDAFVRSMSKLDGLRSEESALAWFYRSLRNASIDQQRRRGASERKLAAFGAELEQSIEPGSELRGVLCRCVGELANNLKGEYVDALRAIEVDELPVKDYAARAGISATNAGARVFRARAALRQQVQRCCGSCAEQGCCDCTCDFHFSSE